MQKFNIYYDYNTSKKYIFDYIYYTYTLHCT